MWGVYSVVTGVCGDGMGLLGEKVGAAADNVRVLSVGVCGLVVDASAAISAKAERKRAPRLSLTDFGGGVV